MINAFTYTMSQITIHDKIYARYKCIIILIIKYYLWIELKLSKPRVTDNFVLGLIKICESEYWLNKWDE